MLRLAKHSGDSKNTCAAPICSSIRQVGGCAPCCSAAVSAGKALTGQTWAEGKAPFTTVEYGQARELAEAVREGLRHLGPRDMIDVQSFCWAVFSHPRIWFGGVKYDGWNEMLEPCREAGVFATNYATADYNAWCELSQGLSGRRRRPRGAPFLPRNGGRPWSTRTPS